MASHTHPRVVLLQVKLLSITHLPSKPIQTAKNLAPAEPSAADPIHIGPILGECKALRCCSALRTPVS